MPAGCSKGTTAGNSFGNPFWEMMPWRDNGKKSSHAARVCSGSEARKAGSSCVSGDNTTEWCVMNQSSLATLRGLSAHKWSVIFWGILNGFIGGIGEFSFSEDSMTPSKRFCYKFGRVPVPGLTEDVQTYSRDRKK